MVVATLIESVCGGQEGIGESHDVSISALGGRITVLCLLDECQNERAGRTLGWAACTSRDFLGYQGYGIINHHK